MVNTQNPGCSYVLQLLGMGSRQSPEQQRRTLPLFWTRWIFTWQLREIASNMVQLQRALNELLEEHTTAMGQSQEKQQQLEKELQAALQDKVRGPGEWWVPPCSSPIAPPPAGGHANCKQGAAARSLLPIRASTQGEAV